MQYKITDDSLITRKGTFALDQISFVRARFWVLPLVAALPVLAFMIWLSVYVLGGSRWLREPTVLVSVLITYPLYRKKILIGYEGKTVCIGSVHILGNQEKTLLRAMRVAIIKKKGGVLFR